MNRSRPLYALLALSITSSVLAMPAQAGLLSPLLWIVRPRVEKRLIKECIQITAGEDVDLRESMEPVCKEFAQPVTKCLLKETEATGRTFGVIVELIRGEFGDDSEVVVKRCSASLLGLPINTLEDMPLRELIESWNDNPTKNDSDKEESVRPEDVAEEK